MTLTENNKGPNPNSILRIDDPLITRIEVVPIREDFVVLSAVDRLVLPNEVTPLLPENDDVLRPIVRVKVRDMLVKAINLLPVNYSLVLLDALRSRTQQQSVYQQTFNHITKNNPYMPLPDIEKLTRAYAADPKFYAPHLTGGAVDVALAYTDSMTYVDMGNLFTHDQSANTFYPELTDVQKENRNLLITTLTNVGFVNYSLEWWHFSYGDKLWAYLTGNPHAIYDYIYDN